MSDSPVFVSTHEALGMLRTVMGYLAATDHVAMAARMLVLGALNWAAEWWNPRRGSLEAVVRTAQSLVRHGLGPRPIDSPAGRESADGQARARRRPIIG